MKITEAKLRKMIRSVIREFVTTTSSGGGKRGGYESPETKAAAQLRVAEPKTSSGVSKVYQRPTRRGGTTYSDTEGGAGGPWTKNPDYTAYELTQINYNRAREADLRKVQTGETPPDVSDTSKKKKDDEE